MKRLLSIAAMTALIATSANADFIRIEGGLGGWQTSPTGTVSFANNSFDVVENAKLEDSTNMYAWVYLKHPIPIVPNVRLEYVDPSFDGTIAEIKWDGKTYAGVHNTMTLTQYDAALYYNILDNLFWMTVDLGLDIKYIDGKYSVDGDVVNNSQAVDSPFSVALPLAYVRGRVQIPVTNIGVELLARGITYSNNTMIDAEIKVDYTMDFVPIVQPGLELGYRYQQLTLDASTIGLDADLDTTLSGVYAGIMVRF